MPRNNMIENESELSPQEALEASYKVIRLKKIEQILYVLQIIIIIIVSIVCLHYYGASLKPFYLPVATLLVLFAFMIFLIYIESFFFRILKMKYSKSVSTKFLIAQGATREAIAVIIVSAIIAGMLFSLQLSNYLERGLQECETHTLNPNNNITVYFQSQGHLGLTKVSSVIVIVTTGSANVYILPKAKFETGSFSNYDAYNSHPPAKVQLENETMSWSPSHVIEGYEELVMYINNSGALISIVKYTINVKVLDAVVVYMPAVAICTIIASVIWANYLHRIKTKLRAESIYK